jgi:LemA protein
MMLIILIALVALLIWVASAYNTLVSLKNQVANAWKQIDVQLKRRHDLIPNLVETVKGAMQFEKGTLEAVVAARSRAVSVASGSGPAGANVAATAAAEGALSSALGRLMAVVEAYPDLKSTGNVAQLQEELTSTENKIAFARQMYNDTATTYNTRQQQFPTNLVAGIAGATRADLWEITDSAERENVRVDLSMTPAPAPNASATTPASN